MAEYLYTREIVTWKTDPQDPNSETKTGYNIDHPIKISEGIFLGKMVKDSFPNNGAKVICNGPECKVIFINTLTTEEKTTLDGLVTTDKTQ